MEEPKKLIYDSGEQPEEVFLRVSVSAPRVSATLVRSTSPSGIIQRTAATIFTTASRIPFPAM